MTPALERNRIVHGDSLKLTAQLPDESVDLIVCDGPYGVTRHPWDQIPDIQTYNLDLIRQFAPKLKEGGALYLFGKPNCIDFIDYRPYLRLKSRIVWYQPSRLSQGKVSYTNNYDIICYFIKGDRPRRYNLDAIRVPQLVELEHRLALRAGSVCPQRQIRRNEIQRKRQKPRRRLGRHQAAHLQIEGAGQPRGAEHDTET